MAIVDNMEKIEAPQNHNKGRQSRVRQTKYFVTENGLQVQTYGSATRKHPDEFSQSMYFEGEALKQLANALQEIQDLNNK